jgi:hypothetical protein
MAVAKQSAARALAWHPRLISQGGWQMACGLARAGVGLHACHQKRRDATHAPVGSGGGRMRRTASGSRFCTMAARWNSSRAPERLRRRSRAMCLQVCEAHLDALPCSRDLRNALVFISRRPHRVRPRGHRGRCDAAHSSCRIEGAAGTHRRTSASRRSSCPRTVARLTVRF